MATIYKHQVKDHTVSKFVITHLLLLLEGRCEVKDGAGTGFLVERGELLTSRPHDDLKDSNLKQDWKLHSS